ncbi:MAG: ExeM/NucH family extracellular endonuclease [Burkholderiaceae bacterium]|nr:ExeM/NucH family extracellular endonuclease [Microbacteriaceae bacterium]
MSATDPSRPRPRTCRRFALVAATGALALGITAVGLPSVASAVDATSTIARVQGSGPVSPLLDTTQTVHGIVTADYRGASGYDGIVVQTAASGGDADPTPDSSDAIFVFLGDTTTAAVIGDLVSVTGTVIENFGQTQLGATGTMIEQAQPATVEVLTPAAHVASDLAPRASALSDTVVGDARESLESMLVTPTGTYQVASSHELDSFGTLWLTAGTNAAVKSTETTDALAPGAATIAADNAATRLLLDDGYNVRIGSAGHPADQPYFTSDVVVRNGDTVNFPVAPYVLSFGFDEWRLQPTTPIDATSPADIKPTFTVTNLRPAAPPTVGGDFQIASFNVDNYFTTLSSDNPDARGAATGEEFALQRGKVVAAISGLGADIVALQEIENNVKLGEGVDGALADLVFSLNAAAGSDVWAYVPTPADLSSADAADITDFITNAIIYKKAAATPVGPSFTDLDEAVWNIAREPIAQTFDVADRVVTVVANHVKSKSPPAGGGDEPSDGQGFFNSDRIAEADQLVSFLDTITADPAKGPDVALLGDINSSAQEDPIQALTATGLVDLIPTTTDDQYTYSFDGELGSLDHAFVTPSLAASIAGAGVWSINSAEWAQRGYFGSAAEADTPFRSSDHDPITFGVSTVPSPVNIDIVSINDFHGRIEESSPAAGAAVLGGMVDSYRAANPSGTLVVSAGDSLGASTFTSFVQKDQPTLDALNSIGLDASALGNHEFDQGAADVTDRILPAAQFAYLAANIYRKGTRVPAFAEYSLSEVEGVTVGFIGAITQELPSLVSPAGIAGLDVGPVAPAVNRVADQLSDGDTANGEADIIVLLVHEGAATPRISDATDDSAFGQVVSGVDSNVDAIVSGHTHQVYNHNIPAAGSSVDRPVIQAGKYGEDYGHLSLVVDPSTGSLLSISSEVLPLFEAFPSDLAVAEIVTQAVATAAVAGAVKVGEITAGFNRAGQADGSENRGGESTLGNFVADVQLWSTQDADAEIAMMNPGGLRANLGFSAQSGAPGDGEGVVTFAEAAGVQPFANTLVALDLTADQLKSVLEEQWQPAGASRPFLKLGISKSLSYTYDPDAAAGSHITAIFVDGEQIDPAATHRVTVNSFLASGGDNFTTLAEGTNRSDTGKIDLQSMVDYFTQFRTAAPDYAQRAVGVVIDPAPDGGYPAGGEIGLDLSSLLFSAGEPNTGTATVSLSDVVLGTSAIDPVIVDTTDEVGRSSLTVTIPQDVSGAQTLTVSVPETGTSVPVPITVAAKELDVMINLDEPTISGTPAVGETLTAREGAWNAGPVTADFQWLRAGVPIDGATNDTYVVVPADAGSLIRVAVVPHADGFSDGHAGAAGVLIPKISSQTYGAPNPVIAFGDQTVSYTAVVIGNGVTPTGTVSVYDGGRRIATGQLAADANGRITIDLPYLGRGFHLLTARFGGNDQLGRSRSWPSLVLVF